MENIDMNQISAAIGLITFLLVILCKLFKGHKIVLSELVFTGIAGGMLPFAVCICISPFYPQYLDSLEKMGLHIMFAGLVLIFFYTRSIIQSIKTDSSALSQ